MPIPQFTVIPSRDRPATFSSDGDTHLSELQAFVDGANALEQSLQLVATTGTSTTSTAIGAGSKSITTQTGKAWVAGSWLYIVSAASVANYMQGQVTSYDSGTGALVVDVTVIGGSGTLASWVIGLAVPTSSAATATTATNIAGGSAGGVPYQSGAGATSITSPGTSTQVLSGGVTPTFVAPFIAGGTAGSVPYQTGPSATGLTAAGAAGQFLQSTGAGAPVFASPPSVTGAFKNLNLSTTGTSAVVVTFDELVVENSSTNSYKTLRAGSLASLRVSSTDTNSLDSGILAVNTWYSVWVIWDGSNISGLISLSATSPTIPSGYTHKARVGWIKTDGTANKYPLSMRQQGRDVVYRVVGGSNVPVAVSIAAGVAGSPGAPTWSTVNVLNACVPLTASTISVTLRTNSASAGVAPTNAYGPSNTSTSPPPLVISSGSFQGSVTHNMQLLGEDIFWYSDHANNALICNGWEDNL